MLYIELVYNLSLLVALTVLSGFIGQRERWSSTTKLLLQGLVFGGIAMIGMLYPLQLAEGVIFDGRSVVISLCAIFFGPISAIIAASMAIILRIAEGGVGVLTGSLVIVESALVGISFYYFLQKKDTAVATTHLIALGVIVHLGMLLLMFTFPHAVAVVVFQRVGLPIITVYPLATVVIGKIIHDNLERATFTQTLIASEKKYRLLAENMSDVIWSSDLGLDLSYVSPSAERLFGESPDAHRLKSTEQRYTPASLETIRLAMEEEFRMEIDPNVDRNRSRVLEIEMYRADGSTVWISTNVTFLRDREGRPIGFQGVTRDISDKKQAEKDLIAAKEQAEESDRLKSAFLMNMSHEIRTPMNGILGFISLLSEPDLEEQSKKEYLEIVNKSGDRLLNTINDIIEISRIESGEVQVILEEVQLDELLRYHYDFFKPQAEQKGLSLHLDCRLDTTSESIVTDRHKVDGILRNLIKNAIKFTSNGSIEVGCYREPGVIIFFVRDTGMGIPPASLDKIFKPFIQADMKLSRAHEGSGLGLPIVKAHVEALNGRLWVESESGNGSTFYVSIPGQISGFNAETPAHDEDHAPTLPDSLSILIAEDDDTSYAYLATILNHEGVALHRTTNGRDTVDAVRDDPTISLVLMDIKMPFMNGLEATKLIREFNSSIPIIAQSAYAAAMDKSEAIEAGCTDYMAKPIARTELFRLISLHCA